MELAIEVLGLQKRYGDRVALDGLDIRVRRGEVYAVLGPNGAGKTSLIEILEGYRARDGGTVRVLGADPDTGGTAWRDRLGVLLQTTSIEPQLSVVEALRMYAGFYRRPRDVDELVALVGLDHARGQRAGTLSGGQQRRLDLALALVGRPNLVFLDEPTTGFDPQARRLTWDLIRGLATEGATVLLTTHYLDEAAQLADRVGVIARGRLVAEGNPATLGGHDLSVATVRFRLPAAGWPRSLDPYVSDGVLSLRTPEPTALLATATAWAVAQGVELAELTVTRPSLEDIYLALTSPEGTHV